MLTLTSGEPSLALNRFPNRSWSLQFLEIPVSVTQYKFYPNRHKRISIISSRSCKLNCKKLRLSAHLYRHWGFVQAVRPIGRSRGIPLLFLDHGTRRGRGVSVTPGPLLTPGKDPVPIYRRLGGPQGRSGQVRKISPPPGFDPRTVQPVVSRYTDWATRPIYIYIYIYAHKF